LLRLFPPIAMPAGDGDFAISRIPAGRYHLNVNLPGEDWYLAGLSVRGANGKLTVIEDVIPVKPAQQLGGVTIAIRTGAAALSGRVTHNSGGSEHSGPIRIYLIPIDQEASFRSAQDAAKTSSSSGSKAPPTAARQSASALPVPVQGGASQAQT